MIELSRPRLIRVSSVLIRGLKSCRHAADRRSLLGPRNRNGRRSVRSVAQQSNSPQDSVPVRGFGG
jgi:hypothetical protein